MTHHLQTTNENVMTTEEAIKLIQARFCSRNYHTVGNLLPSAFSLITSIFASSPIHFPSLSTFLSILLLLFLSLLFLSLLFLSLLFLSLLLPSPSPPPLFLRPPPRLPSSQIHERARQGRLRAKFMAQIRYI